MATSLPPLPVEIAPEQERRVRAYIWAIVACHGSSAEESQSEAVRLWQSFGERYSALVSGEYARNEPEAVQIALRKI
jgi:hypothetical protein